MRIKIGIIDYGLGNVKSIQRMFYSIGYRAELVQNLDEFYSYTHIILPGVGSFDFGMQKLHEMPGLVTKLKNTNIEQKILGICLGMQLLFDKSEEGSQLGLGLIEGSVKKLPVKKDLRVPNMGWRKVIFLKENQRFTDFSRFYFVHSYAHIDINDCTIAHSEHSVRFSAIVKNKNIYGMQFHPEKSHQYGKQLLKLFLDGDL